jgi:hypothetical protein
MMNLNDLPFVLKSYWPEPSRVIQTSNQIDGDTQRISWTFEYDGPPIFAIILHPPISPPTFSLPAEQEPFRQHIRTLLTTEWLRPVSPIPILDKVCRPSSSLKDVAMSSIWETLHEIGSSQDERLRRLDDVRPPSPPMHSSLRARYLSQLLDSPEDTRSYVHAKHLRDLEREAMN